ncbi:MAG TPA: hypothetical protein VIY48_10690 [Candidatus Paceibacterota bacterium]
MGADIHGVLQESYDGKRWTTISGIEDDRNYALFAALADVRNYGGITPIDKPRGLPEGFEGEAGDVYAPDGMWMGDHSYSWLSIDELVSWDGWDQECYEGILRDYVQVFLKWLDWADLKTEFYKGKGRRVVFGFDS